MSDHDIKSHIKVYWNVFFALLAFTVLTVAVSYIHFDSVFLTFFVGLSIACFKGYLVAGFFMHLNDERKTIYYLLGLTTIFLFVLLLMPTFWKMSAESHSSHQTPYVSQDDYVPELKPEKHGKGDH